MGFLGVLRPVINWEIKTSQTAYVDLKAFHPTFPAKLFRREQLNLALEARRISDARVGNLAVWDVTVAVCLTPKAAWSVAVHH